MQRDQFNFPENLTVCKKSAILNMDQKYNQTDF